MAKQSGDKVHKLFSFDFYFAKGLESLSMKKGESMSSLVQKAMEEKYPEIGANKTKVVRRILA